VRINGELVHISGGGFPNSSWIVAPDGSGYLLAEEPMTSPTALRGFGNYRSPQFGGVADFGVGLLEGMFTAILIGTAVEVLAHAIKRSLF
jgi:hypothetical protein